MEQQQQEEGFALSDEQVQNWLINGFIEIPSVLPPQFHKNIFDTVAKVYEKEGNPGNNILPRMPQLTEIYNQPPVVAALTALLGEGYVMHPHRHCHDSHPGRQAQLWHKDSYFGFNKHRHHRPRWAMGMYYCQDTPFKLGPTGASLGSQYYASMKGDKGKRLAEVPPEWLTENRPMVCKAGSVVIIAYDLWHRGMANISEEDRYMFKFQFVRMEEPLLPRWNFKSPEWKVNPIPLEDALNSINVRTSLTIGGLGQAGDTLEEKALEMISGPTLRKLFDDNAKGDPITNFRKKGATAKLMGMTVSDIVKSLKEEHTELFSQLPTKEVKVLKERISKAAQIYHDEYLRCHTTHKIFEYRKPIWIRIWKWLCGNQGVNDQPENILTKEWAEDLKKEEPLSVRAGYLLGSVGGEECVSILLENLKANQEPAARNSAYGLIEAGQPVIPALTALIKDSDVEETIKYALFAVGEIGSNNPETIQAVIARAGDSNKFIRRTAAETLSLMIKSEREKENEEKEKEGIQEQKGKIAEVLSTLVLQRLESDEQTRHHAALSLLKLQHKSAIDALFEALADRNRYVVGYAVSALIELNEEMTPLQRKKLLRHLEPARWCPFTTPDSTF